MRIFRTGAFVWLLAVMMIVAGCAGGDDRDAMDVLEDMLEQEMANDYIHSTGSISLSWDSKGEESNAATGAVNPFNMFGDISEVMVNYEIRQSTELARTDATLSLNLGGITLEAPVIMTETDVYFKIPMFSNEFIHVPLDTITEEQDAQIDPAQIKELIMEFALILKDTLNKDWLTMQDAESYEGILDTEEIAYFIELELTNDRFIDMIDNMYDQQDRIQQFLKKLADLGVVENEEFSISEDDLEEAKEELRNDYDLETFILQVVVDPEDYLREINLDFSGGSLAQERADRASLRLNHTVISIQEPFEFEQEIPENAVLLDDLFGSMFSF